jgi:ADP-ribosylglycohydrolase
VRLTWAQPEDLVAAELAALREQGASEDALAPIERRWISAGGDPVLAATGASAFAAPPELRALARTLLDDLAAAQPDSQSEPDDWQAIERLLPDSPALSRPARAAEDRVRGAWQGRAVGCLLGKPVEKIPRVGIEEIARATGNWPISGYFTARGLPADVARRWPWNRRSAPTSLVENIDGMPEDDDLNFALLALDLVENKGGALTTEDVAEAWLANLPAGRVFTAERAAYRNLLDARPVPESATRHNPFREWIGALIRVDVYGWAYPGDVRSAAKLAWTDARLSHTRNGLYGAMWAAGLCSAALVASSAAAALDAAETVVPPGSRLAAAVALGRRAGSGIATGALDETAALDLLHAELGGLHWVHTLNNASLIACALEAADGVFDRGIALAVAGGWDTDSAGATVGSVLGALGGTAGISGAWSGPLRGRIATSLPGAPERSIDDLTQRTLGLPERMTP